MFNIFRMLLSLMKLIFKKFVELECSYPVVVWFNYKNRMILYVLNTVTNIYCLLNSLFFNYLPLFSVIWLLFLLLFVKKYNIWNNKHWQWHYSSLSTLTIKLLQLFLILFCLLFRYYSFLSLFRIELDNNSNKNWFQFKYKSNT